MSVDSVVTMATGKTKAQLWPVGSGRRHGASVRFQPVCAPTEKMLWELNTSEAVTNPLIFDMFLCVCSLPQETPRTSISSESFPTWLLTTRRSWSGGASTSGTPSGSLQTSRRAHVPHRQGPWRSWNHVDEGEEIVMLFMRIPFFLVASIIQLFL